MADRLNIRDETILDPELFDVVDDIPEEETIMANPAEFSIFANADIEETFINWMEVELNAGKADRDALIKKVRDWRKIANNEDISGRVPPWEGASDINVPVTPIILKTATARLRNVFNARKPFWKVEPLNKATGNPWIERCRVLEKFFNILSNSRHDLNLYAKNSIISTDLPIASTIYVRVPWTQLKRNIKEDGFDESNQLIGSVLTEKVIHDGPEIDVVRIEDVIFRSGYNDIQRMPSFGVIKHLSWYDLELYSTNEGWTNLDLLEGQGRASTTDTEDIDAHIQGVSVGAKSSKESLMWDIVEFWAYYDVNGDGIMEDVIVYYHPESRTILKADHNTLGVRPIREIPMYLKPHSLEGGSMVELTEDMQAEINAMHNLRLDGIHLTEIPMWGIKRGSGIRPKERLIPGKMLFMDSPKEDAYMLNNTKQYVETEKVEGMDYQYMERATGIQDIAGGFSSQLLKSRDTASSQALRLQAGSEVFMGIIEGVDLAYQDIAEMIFRQLVANSASVLEKERKAQRLTEEELSILEDTLDQDIDTIPYMLSFKVRITEEGETMEGKKQNILSLVTIYGQYVNQIIPLMQQVYGQTPVFQQMMQKFVEGASALMEKVFQFFGEDDTQDYMVSSDKIEMINNIMIAMQGGMNILGKGADQIGQPQAPNGQPNNIQEGEPTV